MRTSAMHEGAASRNWAAAVLRVADWGTIDKSLLIAALLLPTYLGFWALATLFNADPRYTVYFDQNTLPVGKFLLLFFSGSWILLIVGALVLRRRQRDSGFITHAAIQLWVVPNALFGLAIGHMTSPWMALILIGGISVGLLFFGLKPTLVGLASFVAVYLGGWIAEARGIIPYAWALSQPPFEGREPAAWWAIGVGGGGLAGSILMALLASAAIRQWRVQHDELERAQVDLAASNALLERRIAERTEELELANDTLRTEMAERQRLQAQLLHSKKMEVVGRLAGGLAHEFNNMLTVIIGQSELLLRRLGADDPNREAPEAVLKVARRAAELVRQLLAYGREQRTEMRSVDLKSLFDRLQPMVRPLFGTHTRLIFEVAEECGSVQCDAAQIEQALMNLVTNARDAMPNGGTLTLRAAPATLESDLEGIPMVVPAGRYLRLNVCDTGDGIAPEHLEEIFNPFFTTKRPGGGTGMGLAVVYGILQQNDGFVVVESAPGEGTCFDLYLRPAEGVSKSAAEAG